MSTVSEDLFASYLSSRGLAWEYEPDFAGKRPDYLVHASGGDFVVEVEELRRPDRLPTAGFSPTGAVREALRRARNQLRGCKHLPSGIVVYSEDLYRSVTPATVAAAAFGPVFQDARRNDVVEPFAPAFRFPSKNECTTLPPKLANPFLSRTDNTSISAVIALMRYRLDEFQVAVWHDLLSRQANGEILDPGASIDASARLQDSVPLTYRFDGTIRVVVIENRHARIPFPEDVFRGPFDQRWTWQDEWLTPTWIGAVAAQFFKEGVPFALL